MENKFINYGCIKQLIIQKPVRYTVCYLSFEELRCYFFTWFSLLFMVLSFLLFWRESNWLSTCQYLGLGLLYLSKIVQLQWGWNHIYFAIIRLTCSFLVCCMFNEAASLASSVLRRLCDKECTGPMMEIIEFNDMLESAGMVFVQSLKELGRYTFCICAPLSKISCISCRHMLFFCAELIKFVTRWFMFIHNYAIVKFYTWYWNLAVSRDSFIVFSTEYYNQSYSYGDSL